MPMSDTTAFPRAPWNRTLKWRLAATTVLVIAVCVVTVTLLVLQHVGRRTEQALLAHERENVARLAGMVGQRVQQLQQVLLMAATAVGRQEHRQLDEAILALRQMPLRAVGFTTVFVADAAGNGRAMLDGQDSVRSTQLGDRDYFRATLAGNQPVISEPVAGRLSNEPIVVFTAPVPSAAASAASSPSGNGPPAVLGGSLRLASRNLMTELARATDAGGSAARVFVVDVRGRALAHPDPRLVMRPLADDLTLQAVVDDWTQQRGAAQAAPQAMPTALARHVKGYFYSAAEVPESGWTVLRVVPDADLLGGLRQAQREAVLWAAGVALLGGLLVLPLLAAQLGPLERLRRRALATLDEDAAQNAPWPQADGEIGELTRVLRQVLEQRALSQRDSQALLTQMRSLLAAAPLGIGITRERRFELAGDEFHRLLGFSPGEMVGMPARQIFHSDADYDALGPQVGAAFAAGKPYVAELQFRRKDGGDFWGQLLGRPVDWEDAGAGTIWILENVTERREARVRLTWHASHDGLTQLLNRAAFEEQLRAWLAVPQSVPASLLFVDLDHFKPVNDTAGHTAGDTVLRQVAHALQGQVRSGDLVARIGGDEFALLLPGCVGLVAAQLAERMRAAVSQIGIDHQGRRLHVGASIGVVEIDPSAGLPATTWMTRADAACYRAKHAGRNAVRLADGRGAPSGWREMETS